MVHAGSSEAASFDELMRELRGRTLSLGVLVLQSAELSAVAIADRDLSGVGKVYDLHERVDELERKARRTANRIAGGTLCDAYRLRKVLESLRVCHLLGRISTRSLEMASRAREVTESVETEALRLLDPLLVRVQEFLRQAITAYADCDGAPARWVRERAQGMAGMGESIAGQLRDRMTSESRLAVVNLSVSHLAELTMEMGLLAVELAEVLLSGEEGQSTSPAGSEACGLGLSA